MIHGDGSQIRAWCYVDDMVAGSARVPGAPGCRRPGVQHRQPARDGDDLRPRPSGSSGSPARDVEIIFQPLHYADVELRIPNVEKAREVLGFAAKVDLDEGLEKTIAWYREKTLSPSA